MPRVVIVSNRLPVSVKKVDGKLEYYPSAGGLATGLSSYAKDGSNKWIGWPGIASDELTDAEKTAVTKELKKHHCHPVFLTQKQLDGFYNGYSNSVLWPLFHHMKVEDGDTPSNWRTYKEVNRSYADATLAMSRPTDRLWVHDYQLMLLPELLRVARPKAHIGFFLHIPFPSPELFLGSKHAAAIAKGLLGADVIGMHTVAYTENFLDSCRELGIGIVAPRKVALPERVVRVTDLPIGIDYKKFADASRSLDVAIELKKLQWKYLGQKVILTIDRLDPSKGLIGRLKAYRMLLAENPKLRGKVVMVMQAMPSRTEVPAYQKLRVDVEKLVSQINSRFGSKRWEPVETIFSPLPFAQYAALYQRADVAFIAPVRDGMNLVAKEYLASHPKSDGILVLSETAGAAEELKDAVLVNPYKLRSLVTGLSDALSMTPGDFLKRTRGMQEHLRRNTLHKWAERFVDILDKPIHVPDVNVTRTLTPTIATELIAQYHQSRRRLILFDYDGTLQPIVSRPEDAKPSSDTLSMLKRLAADSDNHVVVISGRSKDNLATWIDRSIVGPVTLVAEHGACLRLHDHRNWHRTIRAPLEWKPAVTKLFDHYAVITPGSMVEKKEWAVVWHYRNAAPFTANKHLAMLKKLLRPIAKKENLRIKAGKKVLEVHPLDISKGHAVKEWLIGSEIDFVLAIGDDTTDEDMFAALPKTSFTIKVGTGRTLANYRLRDPAAVHQLLRKL